jgi:hypothetical protein
LVLPEVVQLLGERDGMLRDTINLTKLENRDHLNSNNFAKYYWCDGFPNNNEAATDT